MFNLFKFFRSGKDIANDCDGVLLSKGDLVYLLSGFSTGVKSETAAGDILEVLRKPTKDDIQNLIAYGAGDAYLILKNTHTGKLVYIMSNRYIRKLPDDDSSTWEKLQDQIGFKVKALDAQPA